ncbi:hypothetical protein Bhyg_02977 [Pseudolycoriella hygida]|uniref:DUF659 domain-containing protein n=1 Tax=Pseudolycoriella hygida TaxID=35572 RepID=A0A9Q0S744_9DIPT|nr:hypothetical protein Bhyg_02977 [Pseudolycoriella hygida]
MAKPKTRVGSNNGPDDLESIKNCDLVVKLTKSSTKAKSLAWSYFGSLHFKETDKPVGSKKNKYMCNLFIFRQKYKVSAVDDLPHRTSISRALTTVYADCKSWLVDHIRSNCPATVAVTFDGWSDKYRRRNYVTLTLHYVNKFYELINLTLSTSHFPDRHQAKVILPFIESLLDTFRLSQKNIYMVTDAALRYRTDEFEKLTEDQALLAAEISEWSEVLLEDDDDDEAEELLQALFSSSENDNLKAGCHTSLKMDVETKWYSVLIMMESLIAYNKNVINVLLFTLSVNNSLSVSFNVVASDILKIWQSCEIPCIRKDKVCKKIKALFDEYRLLKKHKYRRTKTQISREEKFKKMWKGLFDIATSNLDSMVSSTRIKLFLKNQRTKRNLKLKYLMHEAPIVSEPRCHTNTLIEDDTDTDEEVEVTTDTDTEYVANGASDQNLVEKSASDLVNKIVRAPAITSALDRIKLTSGKFRYLVGSVAKVVNASPSKSRISKNTIERNRKKNRKIIARNITTDFISKFASEACVIHWDGKLLTNVNGTIGTVKTKVDRIAVAVISNGNSKLLGIPKGDRGTGENMANIMHKEILIWKLTNVVGLCADTTSSNTGWKSGASALLQGKYLNDQKIFFPCRHHIYELILSQVFILFFDRPESPDVISSLPMVAR